MIINKVFDIILNITNINDIFNRDINNTILNMVKRKYNNKCFFGVYIIDITKILNRSLIESNQSDLNGSFNIFIQFEGKCIIYNTGEVIFNMEIKENINNMVPCTNNDNILAIIKLNKINFEFKKGSLIPIIVGKSKFVTGSDTIQINSYPFIPIVDNKKVYYKINNISDETYSKLNEFIEQYINVEEEVKHNILSNNNNKWEYFKNLIYPFKNNKSKDIIKSENYIDILELKKMNNSIIHLNNEVDLSERLVNIYKDTNALNEITEFIEDDEYIILYNILKKYYLYLNAINQLSTIYNTDIKIKNNEHIFNFYIKYKK